MEYSTYLYNTNMAILKYPSHIINVESNVLRTLKGIVFLLLLL